MIGLVHSCLPSKELICGSVMSKFSSAIHSTVMPPMPLLLCTAPSCRKRIHEGQVYTPEEESSPKFGNIFTCSESFVVATVSVAESTKSLRSDSLNMFRLLSSLL